MTVASNAFNDASGALETRPVDESFTVAFKVSKSFCDTLVLIVELNEETVEFNVLKSLCATFPFTVVANESKDDCAALDDNPV